MKDVHMPRCIRFYRHANGVWGKVMFFRPVCLFTEGESFYTPLSDHKRGYDVISYLDAWSYVPSRGISCSMFLSGMVYVQGALVWGVYAQGRGP